jgi:hypothetical protein
MPQKFHSKSDQLRDAARKTLAGHSSGMIKADG